MARRKRSFLRRFLTLILIAVIVFCAGIAILLATGKAQKIDGVVYIPSVRTGVDINNGDLILVDSEYEYRIDKTPTVSVSARKNRSYKVRDNDIRLRAVTVKQLNDLFTEVKKATGANCFCVNSGYRSREEQDAIYNERIDSYGEDRGSALAAMPGHSEHETGLACDLVWLADDGSVDAINTVGAYGELAADCWKYGFVQRYKADKTYITGISNEPWHFRYVGAPHAYIMEREGLCLEEYVDYVRDYTYEQPLVSRGGDGSEALIYFCGGTSITVPLMKKHSVSGNNIDGFIVTVYP